MATRYLVFLVKGSCRDIRFKVADWKDRVVLEFFESEISTVIKTVIRHAEAEAATVRCPSQAYGTASLAPSADHTPFLEV